ncbi:MAG: major capsid protein, partial [Treponema sp.]|nr:major capsid protein [Treponema sp.]
MLDILKNFLKIEALVGTLNRLPPLRTFIMDLIYPESVRFNHPFDRLVHSDLGLPTKNIPLVTRGSVSYAVTPDPTELKQIDPANIAPSIVVDASDLNRLKTLGFAQQQQWIERKV